MSAMTKKWRKYTQPHYNEFASNRVRAGKLNEYLLRYYNRKVTHSGLTTSMEEATLNHVGLHGAKVHIRIAFKALLERAKPQWRISSTSAFDMVKQRYFPAGDVPFDHGEFVAAAMLLGHKFQLEPSTNACWLCLEPSR